MRLPHHIHYWCDDDDLYHQDGTPRKHKEIVSHAVDGYRDLLVSRPTEMSAFLRGLSGALTTYQADDLTDRQAQAVIFAHEARLLGLTETTYIADKLDINRHSAWKLLHRADRAKKETSGKKVVELNKNDMNCAWCDCTLHNTRIVDLPLCHDCYRHMRSSYATEKWVREELVPTYYQNLEKVA